MALEPRHPLELKVVDPAFERVGIGCRVAPPDFTFDIVLEEHARNGQMCGKIYRGIEKVADRNLEPALVEGTLNHALDSGRRESSHGVGQPRGKAAK